MRFGPLCRFVHRFAWRDLLDPGARRSTRVNAASMTLVTALTLASVGLALGTTEIKRADLTKDPLTLCLWVGDPNLSEKIEKPLWDQFDAALRKGSTADGYLACYPFHVHSENWLRTGIVAGGSWERITGRSVLPGDDLLKSREPFLSGGPFTRPDQAGVVVSKSMLETLGLPVTPPPSELILDISGGREPIPVVGVFEKDLPNNQQFVVTESYYRDLRKIEAGLFAKTIETGPVPDSWPLFKDMPEESRTKILNQLNSYGVDLPPEELAATKGRGRAWRIRSENSDPPSRSNWLTMLDSIQGIMGSSDADFANPSKVRLLVDPPPKDAPGAKAEPGWEMIGFYFNRVDKLPLAAGVIAGETSLPVHKDVIGRLEGFEHASSKPLLSCLVGAVVLLASSCANLRVIQELRSELKLGEIGMLKAMGMSGGLLSGIFLYEAALVWAVGSLAGLALGYALGALMSWAFLASTPSEILVGFWCPWYIWLLPLITGPTFLFSAFWGIRRARRSPPIAVLRSS